MDLWNVRDLGYLHVEFGVGLFPEFHGWEVSTTMVSGIL